MNKTNVAVVDWGSSKVMGDGGVIFNYSRKEFRGGGGLPPMAYLDSGELELLFNSIQQTIGNPDVIGFTGLNHSVVPWEKNGVVRVGLVGDDPSLTPLGGLPDRLKPYYLEDGTRPASAVRKVAGLQEHPELLAVLGLNGDGNIRYTTLLSLAAMRLLGMPPEETVIFPDEAMDFLNGNGKPRTREQIPGIFGLTPDQLKFGDSSILQVGGKEVWVMQDLRAELKVIKGLFDRSLIPSGSKVMATDSVWKGISQFSTPESTPLEDLHYETMRMMGNTGLKYVWPLLRERGMASGVGEMFGYFEKTLRESTLPNNWFYDPRADENKGVLWRKNEKSWQRVSIDELMNDTTVDVDEVLRAYGWGMAAAMYENLAEPTDDIVIYGGLMCLFGNMQPGWKHVFLESAPSLSQVHWLKMPDSRVALEMVIREEKGEQLDYSQEVPLMTLGQGGGMCGKWQDMKHEIVQRDSLIV